MILTSATEKQAHLPLLYRLDKEIKKAKSHVHNRKNKQPTQLSEVLDRINVIQSAFVLVRFNHSVGKIPEIRI